MIPILLALAAQSPSQPDIVIRIPADQAADTVAALHQTDIVSETDAGSFFDPASDADADVAAAQAQARANGRMVMIVLGGDWCHDSRALAGLFETADFDTMLRDRYEVVMVDVGRRDRNLHIPARYGITALTGTPTVLILSPEGTLLNRGTAASWRNAASRRRDTIYAAFANFRGARR